MIDHSYHELVVPSTGLGQAHDDFKKLSLDCSLRSSARNTIRLAGVYSSLTFIGPLRASPESIERRVEWWSRWGSNPRPLVCDSTQAESRNPALGVGMRGISST